MNQNQQHQDIFQSFQTETATSSSFSKRRKKQFGWGSILAGVGIGFLAGVFAVLVVFYAAVLPRALPVQGEQTTKAPPQQSEPQLSPISTPYVRTPAPVSQTERPIPTFGAATAAQINPNQADVAQVAEVVRRSIVGVLTKQPTEFTDEETGETITLELRQGNGSGIIMTEDGYIMTNYHVIASGELVYIALDSGEELPAEVIGTDAMKDLAILKINRDDLVPIAVGDSKTLRVGERAIAIGNPMGVSGSVTLGIISAVEQPVYLPAEGASRTFIQTDAAINPGNSGGALVNAKGELVGINTLKSLIAGYDVNGNAIDAEGIGYAISVDEALPIAEELIRRGRVDRPGIGVTIIEIDEATAEKNNIESGLMVSSVVPGGPAERAGMKADDVIRKVDGQPVTKMADLLAYIQSKNFDDVIVIEVMRETEKMQFEVIVRDMNEMRTPAIQQK